MQQLCQNKKGILYRMKNTAITSTENPVLQHILKKRTTMAYKIPVISFDRYFIQVKTPCSWSSSLTSPSISTLFGVARKIPDDTL